MSNIKECKCLNCKYYWNNECHNKDLKNSIAASSIKDNFVKLAEDGYLAEYLKEHDYKAYMIANVVLERLKDLGYLKKNIKNIKNFRDIDVEEEFLNEFVEMTDDVICNFVIPRIKDVELNFQVDEDFCCNYWE